MWRMKGPVVALTWMDKKAVRSAGTYTQAPAENLPESTGSRKMAPFRKLPAWNWCLLTTSTWVVWIRKTTWNPTTPLLCLERNGGVGLLTLTSSNTCQEMSIIFWNVIQWSTSEVHPSDKAETSSSKDLRAPEDFRLPDTSGFALIFQLFRYPVCKCGSIDWRRR